jgi:hypothetical protein
MRFNALATLALTPAVALAQPSQPAQPAANAPQAQYSITVLDAGAEPRREFRYDLDPSQEELMVMRMDVDQTITADGVMAREMVLPTMVMEIDLETAQIADGSGDKPEGTIDAEFQFASFTAEDRQGSPPGLGAMLSQNLQGFTTVSGGLTLRPTGRLTQLRIDNNADTPPAVQQSLSQTINALRGAFAPFPDEAVGVGATWRLDMVIPFPQFTMSQRVDYTLSKVEGDVVTLNMKIQQSTPDDQEIEDVEGEWDNTVAEAGGTGTGKVVIDLNRLAPITSEMETDNRVVVDSTQAGGKTAQTVVESKTRVETTGEVK